ncbi:hypothetical protein DPMN_167870 [Dreissena polymorpha]|uniref:Uncharacterized protein n=1 Tax=Dreissena polymorpha TaxID=45954 RepID=A0A9D4EZL9_DREPO|nr:hypothetical protein DPMN_167870 [Dreissena polymorpha]
MGYMVHVSILKIVPEPTMTNQAPLSLMNRLKKPIKLSVSQCVRLGLGLVLGKEEERGERERREREREREEREREKGEQIGREREGDRTARDRSLSSGALSLSLAADFPILCV